VALGYFLFEIHQLSALLFVDVEFVYFSFSCLAALLADESPCLPDESRGFCLAQEASFFHSPTPLMMLLYKSQLLLHLLLPDSSGHS